MSCTGNSPNNSFFLRPNSTITFGPTDTDKKYLCNAENVLQKLYKSFTAEQTVTAETPLTTSSITSSFTPGSCLRLLPTNSNIRDLFFEVDKLTSTTKGDENDRIKIQMRNMLVSGSNASTPQPRTPLPADFTNAESFKGIDGLDNAVILLKNKVNAAIDSGSKVNISTETNNRLNYMNTFYKKKQTKDTLEEISYRENQIYREKFLYIILMLIGVFGMGIQLRQRYFSDVSFGSGGFGGLFSGFGSSFGNGATSIGSFFSSSAYSLKSR